MYNIETLYKSRSEAIKFYDDYSLMMSEAKTKAAKGTGLKILTSKQMLQRLPIPLPIALPIALVIIQKVY